MGTQRCPMEVDRTNPAAAAAVPTVAGRPWQDTRAVLNGNLVGFWARGAQWRELPRQYPSYQTCHRRFQKWGPGGKKLERILRVLAEELHARGKLRLEEAFIDASFTGAKKRGLAVGPTKRGKGTKIVAITDDHGLPLAVSVEKCFAARKPNSLKASSDKASSTPSRHD